MRGLRTIYREGLARVDEIAIREAGGRFALLGAEEQDRVLGILDATFEPEPRRDRTFVDEVIAHTLEGSFAAPEYGGNRDLRVPMLIIGDLLFVGFFVILAWYGWQVIVLLYGDTLVSVPWVLVSFTQSVIPIGCVLITLCQLVTLPERFREARLGLTVHDDEHDAIEAAVRDTESNR